MSTPITWPFVICAIILNLFLIYWFRYAYKSKKLSLESCKSGSTHETELYRMLGESRLISIRSLAIYRTIVATYTWYLIVHGILDSGFFKFRNFTVWNWIILVIFYTFISIMSWLYYFESVKQIYLTKCLIFKSKYFGYITWILYQINCSNVLYVDIIAWFLLFPFATKEQRNQSFLDWFSMNMHLTNLFVIYIDLFMNQIPVSIHFFVFNGIFSMLYLFFQWIFVQFNNNEYSYPFLDTTKLYYLSFYVGLFGIGIFFCFCSVQCTKFRNKRIPLELHVSQSELQSGQGSKQASLELIQDKFDA